MPMSTKERSSPVRRVFCTHCDQASEVAPRAMSVVCPHCNKRLIIEDYTIKSYHAVRQFATCGDIVVEKRGWLVALVKTGNLTVKGKVQGNVVARGHVSIDKTGSLIGSVQAAGLSIKAGGVLDGFLRIGEPGRGPESMT